MVERLRACVTREGQLEMLDLAGQLHVHAADETASRAHLRVDLSELAGKPDHGKPATKVQLRPKMDTATFYVSSCVINSGCRFTRA